MGEQITKNNQIRNDEYNFLQNLCGLHQGDRISSFDFSELIKEFCGYSKAPEYLHTNLIDQGIDINDY